MRNKIFTSVLLAAPLAMVNAAPESEYETQERERQAQQEQTEFEQSSEEMGRETEQEFDEAGQEMEQTGEEAEQEFEQTEFGQESEQEFEEAGQEMDQAGEETEQEFEEAGMGQDQQGGGQAEVARAQFTSEVQDKEPVDEVSNVEVSEDPVFFFTEVENAEGQTITHRWKRDGEVMAEVPLEVGSDEWRTWSSKELMPEWDGEWTVEVVDAQGNVITEESVTVERGQGQMQQAGQQDDQQGQFEEAGQQDDQQGQFEEAGQQDDQQDQDQMREVEFEGDVEVEGEQMDVEGEAEVPEEDWQDVEFEDDTTQTEDEPLFQDTAEEDQEAEATEEEEDWITKQ